MRRSALVRGLLYLGLLLLTVFYLLPLWGALTTSLKTDAEVDTTNPLSFPQSPTFQPYGAAFSYLRRPLLNSLLITLGGTLGSVALGAMCGYVLANFRFKYDNLVFLLITVGIFLPFQAILIPLFQTIRSLGLYDSVLGLILAHTAYGIPMCTLMFRVFYGELPSSLVKQALTDGSGPWRTYLKVVLPSTKIATVTVLIFQFTSIWNELLFGLVIGGPRSMPATVALNNLAGTLAAQWNVQMAGSMLLAIPVLLLYIFLGRYLIRGYMAGSVTAT
ncbi:carbohydrate ABC transporter permease [Candidatus Bipolaricaulota bacterium]|nr:carbohydrate ABC transporter permease [Candidatus Bipolaricaulota bacterium]